MLQRGVVMKIFRQVLFAWLFVVVAAAAVAEPVPYIIGSYDDRQTANNASLAGTYVAGADEVPESANVILLGDMFAAPDHYAIYELQQKKCRIIRLAGKNQVALQGTIKSYKEYVQAGNNPFADRPKGMGNINQPSLFPILETIELKKADRSNIKIDYLPKPLFNTPVGPEPDYVPPMLAQLAKTGRVSLDIEFAPESPDLPNSAYAMLNQIVKMMRANAGMKILVEGHTDNYHGSAYNLNLSRQRANNVKEWIVESGISAARIRAVGYGESRPIGDNNTSAGRRANRRVEIVKE